jgi:hypothetical protein
MKFIYAGSRPCKTASEAAREITRISGEDASVWQITHALLWGKGSVNGVPVCVREITEPALAEAILEAAAEHGAPEDRPRRRTPLMRMEGYTGGIPPRWR